MRLEDTAVKIEQLSDFSAVRQVAEALWRTRACVFVGAGFSRNAELVSPNAPLPPLWDTLARKMSGQLYSDAPAKAPSDPLRLAEEFRSYYGQAALDDFVRLHVHDAAWSPGPLHKALLELPWSDVLTTNYDTLLERAAQEINQRNYEPVRQEADFAHAQAPRIVKLHGSIGSSEHFIIAEEDYRTYPAEHAAFVNFARQSFVENELCLLGFSGDDANFLQWSGWVRDHLGSSSRRIYLVGVLNLTAAKRKFLESRNIAPIDLAPLVDTKDDSERHVIAADIFLRYLQEAKPEADYEWRPTQPPPSNLTPDDMARRQRDPAFAAELFHKMLPIWRANREAYPGWLICPGEIRVAIEMSMHDAPWPNAVTLGALDDHERARLLYELAWQTQTSFGRLDPTVAELLSPFADAAIPCGLTKAEQLELALVLASEARHGGDDAAFERWAGVIEAHAPPKTEATAELVYQRALRARDRRDLALVEELIPKIDAPDPVWGLRRAALLCDLGASDEAEKVVTATLSELRRRQRLDRTSLWVASRRAWAEWFAEAMSRNRFQVTESLDREFEILKCNPWRLIDSIEAKVREEAKKKREESVRITPKFEPGHYQDSANTVRLRSTPTHGEQFRRLIEDAGIPLRMEYVTILADAVRDLVEIAEPEAIGDWLLLARLVHSNRDPILGRHFSRVRVAGMDPALRAGLINALRTEATYWRRQLSHPGSRGRIAGDRLGATLEMLARLSVCQSSDDAEALVTFGLEIFAAREGRSPWLCESVGHLIEFCGKAMTLDHRSGLALRILEFPTAGEAGLPGVYFWPSASSWLSIFKPQRPEADSKWGVRISALIKLVADGGSDRSEAVFRLADLVQHDALTTEERDTFAQALWSILDDGDPPLPMVDRLLKSAFSWLPAPDSVHVEPKLRSRIYGAIKMDVDIPLLHAIAAMSNPPHGQLAILPTGEETRFLFDTLSAWRPKLFVSPIEGALSRSGEDSKASAVALVLGRILSNGLDHEDRTEDLSQQTIGIRRRNRRIISYGRATLFHFICAKTAIVYRSSN